MAITNLGKGKKVIFFDLNGTLIRGKTGSELALTECLNQYTARWQDEDKEILLKKAVKIYHHAIRNYKRKHGNTLTEKLRRAAIKRAIASLPISNDDATIRSIDRELVSIMRAQSDSSKETISVLRKLRRHYKLALITNGSERGVRARMRSNKLASIFASKSVIVSSGSGKGMRKPHPDFFKHALSRMNVSPRQALMVGDSWRYDIEGAAGSGIDAVWVNPQARPEPRKLKTVTVVSIRDIKELTELL